MQQNHNKWYQDFFPPAPPLKLITKKIRRYCFFTWKQLSKHWLWAESLLATLLSYRWRSMERHFLLHLVRNKTMISPAFWFLQYKNWGEKELSWTNALKYGGRRGASHPSMQLGWEHGRADWHETVTNCHCPQHLCGLQEETFQRKLRWTTKKQHINRCKMFLFKWNAHRSAKETNFMLPNGRKAAL